MARGWLKLGFYDEVGHTEFDSCSSDGKVGVNFEPDLLDASLLVHLPPQLHHPHHLQPAGGQVEGGGEEDVAVRGDFSSPGSPTQPERTPQGPFRPWRPR